jgi:hypothetical protein
VTELFLAMIAPDDQGPTIVGLFDDIDQAKSCFGMGDWFYSQDHQQWWQHHVGTDDFNDNEIHPLTVGERLQ